MTRNLPDDPLAFIKACVKQRHLVWTYHVNMRMKGRFIPRETIIDSMETYEIIEAYPADKYLPSYLVHAQHESKSIHILFAADVENDNIRVVTAYRPSPEQWEADMKRRKK